jgi:hypothetical protein
MLLCWTCVLAGAPLAWSQDKNKTARKNTKAPKAKPQANTRSLDQRADTLVNSYVREAGDLADEYLDAGHPDKALAVLQRASAINPDDPSLKQKMAQIQQQNLTANEVQVDVNAGSGWEPVGVVVTEGKPFRAAVEGSYRLEVAGTVSAAGLLEKDVTTDLIGGVDGGGDQAGQQARQTIRDWRGGRFHPQGNWQIAAANQCASRAPFDWQAEDHIEWGAFGRLMAQAS